MRISFRHSILVFALGCGLSACSKGAGPGEPREFKPAQGSLSETVAQMYKSDSLESCDLKVGSQIVEIARELDQRASAIAQLNAKVLSQNPGKVQITQIGDYAFTKMRAVVSDVDKTDGSSYESEDYGWDSVLEEYSNVKGTPTSIEWLMINEMFRGILFNDEDRLVYYKNSALTRDSQPAIESALKTVEECLARPNCLELDFKRLAAKHYVSKGAAHQYWADRVHNISSSYSDRREAIGKLSKWLAMDAQKFGFKRNVDITLVDGALRLPLRFDAFGGSADQVAELFQSIVDRVWKTDVGSILIEPSTNLLKAFFRILYLNESGGRAFVMFDARTMTLYSHANEKTIAHELGHVLGFRDRYFTSWDSVTCKYKDEYKRSDIMSASGSGRVLPEHWEKLTSVYGN